MRIYVCVCKCKASLKVEKHTLNTNQPEFKFLPLGAGEVAQQIRSLAALSEEPALFPASVLEVHGHCEFSARGHGNLLWLLWVPTYT